MLNGQKGGKQRVMLSANDAARAINRQPPSGILEPSQVWQLQSMVQTKPVTIRGATAFAKGWPNVEIFPMKFAWDVSDALIEDGIGVVDVRLEGNVVACTLDPSKELKTLEFVFRLSSTARQDLYRTRDVLLDIFTKELPEAYSEKDRHMVAAAYLHSMSITAPQVRSTDEAWTQYSFAGTSGSPNMSFKFVEIPPLVKKIDEYSVQIILSKVQLEMFVRAHATGRRMSEGETPEVRFECLVGTPQEALKALTPAPKKVKKVLGDFTNTAPLAKPSFTPKKSDAAVASSAPVAVRIETSAEVPGDRPVPGQVTSLYVNKMVESLNCIGDAIMCRSCCNSSVQEEEFKRQLDNVTIAIQPDKINPPKATATALVVEHEL